MMEMGDGRRDGTGKREGRGGVASLLLLMALEMSLWWFFHTSARAQVVRSTIAQWAA